MKFAACLLALACATGSLPASASDKPLNVIVIGADTLRADHLSLYGYARPTSPNLERLAAHGVVFDNAFAQGSYTLPSFASFFTSLYPEQHKATSREKRIKDSATTLAEAFSGRGYRTAGFTGGPFLIFDYGFDKGFQTYLNGDLPRPLDSYIPAALSWIDQDRTKPFFLFLQPQDVHPPFDELALPKEERDRWDPGYDGPVEKFMGSRYFYYEANLDADAERDNGYEPPASPELKTELQRIRQDPREMRHLASVYDDRVAHFDRSFAALWKELETRGLLDDTIVVLMSDHGTLFGEGGHYYHADHLSTLDAIFHVALVVWAPGLKPARVRSPVELIDAAPTLLDLAGLPARTEFQGRSLTDMMKGSGRSELVFGYAILASGDVAGDDRVRRFVRDERWKLAVADPGGVKVLYDLTADPEEKTDVSTRYPDVVRRLSGELLRHLQVVGRPD